MNRKKFNPNEADDRARLLVALVLSLGILFAFNYFYDKPRQQQAETAQQTQAVAQKTGVASADTVQRARDAVLAEAPRIAFSNDEIRGSISLKGARLDDLLLKTQYKTVDKKDNVALLTPRGAREAFYVENGYLSDDKNLALPDNDSLWRVKFGSPSELKGGGEPVVIVWDNGQGVTFERTIALDSQFLFTVTDRIINNGGHELTLNAYQLAARHGVPPDFQGFFVLHEGPISFLNGKGDEQSYKDLAKGESYETPNAKGWLGITDKYWMVSLLPPPDALFNARIVASNQGGQAVYQADTVSAPITVGRGAAVEHKTNLYAGIKTLSVIQHYEEKYGFENLQYSIDFGILYFITKPFYLLLHFLMHALGNVGSAILLMTVIIRALVYPLASKSFTSMAKMKVVAPKLKELQEKHGNDKAALQMDIFELYKRENVNPFSGCWPLLVQIPIFFALYKVILISIELRHTPFWGWVDDLSAPDPTTVFNLFGLIDWQPPSILMLGAWPLIFGFTMVLQKRITPPMADPVQEKIQAYFPYVITVMMAHFSVGLVIYWAWSNILSTLQQYYILKTVGGEDTSLIRGHAGRRKTKAEKKAAEKKEAAEKKPGKK
jgi:YidC/Oxa1 family membrane protein insertase